MRSWAKRPPVPLWCRDQNNLIWRMLSIRFSTFASIPASLCRFLASTWRAFGVSLKPASWLRNSLACSLSRNSRSRTVCCAPPGASVRSLARELRFASLWKILPTVFIARLTHADVFKFSIRIQNVGLRYSKKSTWAGIRPPASWVSLRSVAPTFSPCNLSALCIGHRFPAAYQGAGAPGSMFARALRSQAALYRDSRHHYLSLMRNHGHVALLVS